MNLVPVETSLRRIGQSAAGRGDRADFATIGVETPGIGQILFIEEPLVSMAEFLLKRRLGFSGLHFSWYLRTSQRVCRPAGLVGGMVLR